MKTIIRSIWFNTKIWSDNKTNTERQFDNRFFTSRANSSSWLSSTSLFTMRYRFTRVKLYSSKQIEKSRMKHFWKKSIFFQDSALITAQELLQLSVQLTLSKALFPGKKYKFLNKLYLLCKLKFFISLTISSACFFQGPPP